MATSNGPGSKRPIFQPTTLTLGRTSKVRNSAFIGNGDCLNPTATIYGNDRYFRKP